MSGQKQSTETVDGEPMPEAAEAIEDFIPGSAELAVVDPTDRHEVMLSMDEHDVRMLLERAQKSALRKWVYELEGQRDREGKPIRGLTIHAVQDLTQQMNWSGKCRIGVLPDTLEVEQITANAGNGEEPFWVATIFARDEVTGAMLPGSSMEPHRMRLKPATARRKRENGAQIPEDNTVFDPFSRWKAIQKATRNALSGFIPEQVEQTIIAMYGKDPSRVERIQTEAEAKLAELPPPLDDDEAKAKIERARAMYDEVHALGGEAIVEFPPGKFGAYLLNAQHSHEMLDAFLSFLEGERDRLTEKYGAKS